MNEAAEDVDFSPSATISLLPNLLMFHCLLQFMAQGHHRQTILKMSLLTHLLWNCRCRMCSTECIPWELDMHRFLRHKNQFLRRRKTFCRGLWFWRTNCVCCISSSVPSSSHTQLAHPRKNTPLMSMRSSRWMIVVTCHHCTFLHHQSITLLPPPQSPCYRPAVHRPHPPPTHPAPWIRDEDYPPQGVPRTPFRPVYPF